jgi:hypothetical protein
MDKANGLSSSYSMFSFFEYVSEVFSLKVKHEQKGENRLITIEQTRFLADGTNNSSLRWKIPINICTKSRPNESVYQLYLDGEKKQEFLLKKIPETDWIKLNLFR